MNDESLTKLICKLSDLRRQSPGTAEHYACVAMLDARIAQAETAERVANAVERWRREAHAANWQAVVNCLHGYDLAKEAVRKLEEGT